MTKIQTIDSAARRRYRWLSVALAAVLLPVSACNLDETLRVEDPAVATPESLENPNALPTLVAGAIGDFQVAYSGNGLADAFLPATGLFSDEFRSSDTFTTRNDVDRREQTSPANGNLGDISYTALHRARRSLQAAARTASTVALPGDARQGELLGLAGYTYVSFGEGFCSNVPFSEVVDGQFVPGPSLTTTQMFDTAIVRFAAARTALTGTDAASVSRLNLARVGNARALLNKGSFAEAAAAVSGVPTSFIYFIEHSANTPRQENSLWNLNGSNRRYTVSDREGINGQPFRSANDPRIPFRDRGTTGFDAATRLFEQFRYENRDADVPLADGIEARLIEAEAALRAGNTATWLTTLNALRADVRALMVARYQNYALYVPNASVTNTTLAPLTDPGSATARVDLMFSERAFWLYATGHRLGDLRRLIKQYGRAANTVFPTGAWHKGGNYGPDVAMLVPFTEVNNPNFNPGNCSATTP